MVLRQDKLNDGTFISTASIDDPLNFNKVRYFETLVWDTEDNLVEEHSSGDLFEIVQVHKDILQEYGEEVD